MNELEKLPNIGKELAKQLNDIGINTAERLKIAGSRAAWIRILTNDPSACYMRLCALEGAIQGVRWHHLPDKIKKELKDFYDCKK